ncbi:MAG: hypothetical protein ACI84D_000183, partial [Thalassolituus oleivorans]
QVDAHPIALQPELHWREDMMRHQERLLPVVGPHLDRKSAGQKHPVVDFLFEYYRFRPSLLMKWSPGLGVKLENGAEEFGGRKHFSQSGPDCAVHVDGLTPARQASTRWVLELLQETQARPPLLGCHGLHEWAMVYRSPEVRHEATRLRVSPDTLQGVVEAGPLMCTHHDAFRFFTSDARPLNRHQPAPGTVHELEQPGCLHANMDVYRWAMKRYPWVPSALIADSFLLALEIRELDMRASPYDLSELGYAPIPIEEESGRAEYRRLQLDFFRRTLPLRDRLIDAYAKIIAACQTS